MAIVAVVAVIAAAALYLTLDLRSGPPTVDGEVIDRLASPGGLTAESVAGLDKDNAFWAYFANAAQQPIVTNTQEYYFVNKPTDAPASLEFRRSGFDYRTKKIVQATDSYNPALGRDRVRCYDGKEYYRQPISDSWRERPRESLCDLQRQASAVNDGMNTGGLTAQQAEAFVGHLRKQDGLVTVQSVELFQKPDGKQYLHFSVELRPVPSGRYNYLGKQWWMFAFKETGLDPDTHTFGYSGAGGEGADIEYFVDPVSKLPAYSEIRDTAGKDSDGNDEPIANYSRRRIQYEFGTLPDVSTNDERDIALDW